MHEENYDLIGIAESWLHSSHDWAINIPGYALFQDRQGITEGWWCLSIREK